MRKRGGVLAVIGLTALGGSLVFGASGPVGAASNQPVTVTNTASQPVPVTGSVGVAGTVGVSGTVNVGNLPATQPVSGSVGVNNFPATQNVAGTVSVGNLPAVQNVAGSVGVTNFPATQNVAGTVSVGNLPAIQNVAGTVKVSNLPEVQNVAVTNPQTLAPYGVDGRMTVVTTHPVDANNVVDQRQVYAFDNSGPHTTMTYVNVSASIKAGQKPLATMLLTIGGKPVFFNVPLTLASQAGGGTYDFYIGTLGQPLYLPPNTQMTLSITRAESDTYQLQGGYSFTTINLD